MASTRTSARSFSKICTYFPYNAKLCINGHQYVKQQLAKEGIPFEALDNGVLSCANPTRLQQLCDGLSAHKINALLRKWLAHLPHPFTPQVEQPAIATTFRSFRLSFPLTQVLDRPTTGRVFFEEVIRENLDIGRPDHVQLIFERRITEQTAGRFRTRVITEGVAPRHCTSTTSVRESSSITRRAAYCGPRRRSMIPTTSASASGCLIFPPYGG